MTLTDYIKNLTQFKNQHMQSAQTTLSNYTAQQEQIRQAALVKVDNIMSQLQFSTGQKLDVKLNSNQLANVQSGTIVNVSLKQDTLEIKPAAKILANVSVKQASTVNLANTAINQLEANSPKGNIVSAHIIELNTANKMPATNLTQNPVSMNHRPLSNIGKMAEFSFENTLFQISLNALKTDNKAWKIHSTNPLYLLIKPQKGQLNATVINSNPPVQLNATPVVTAQLKVKEININGEKLNIEKLINTFKLTDGPYKLTQTKQGILFTQTNTHQQALINKQDIPVKLNTLLSTQIAQINQSLSPELNQARQREPIQYLVKNILIENDQVKFNLAGQPIQLKLSPEQSALLSEKNIQFANLKIDQTQAELSLEKGIKLTFTLPVRALANQLFTHFANQPQTLIELLKQAQIDLPNQISHKLIHSAKDQLSFNLQLGSLSQADQLIVKQKNQQLIKIELTPELKKALIESQLFKDNEPPVKPTSTPLNALTNSNQTNISALALLKDLNLSPDNKHHFTTTVLSQLKQIIQQQGQNLPNLALNLQSISEYLTATSQSTGQPNSLSNALTHIVQSSKMPLTAEQIQQQIQSQLAMPNVVNSLNNLNNGLANNLIQALQSLLRVKLTSNHKNNDTKNTITSNNTTQDKDALTDKLTSATTNAVKHLQHNQHKSAQSQAQGQNQIYATVPFSYQDEIQQAQLAINIEPDEIENEQGNPVKLWKFSLKFEFTAEGKLLAKAALIEDKLKLNIYSESQELTDLAKEKINYLRQRLNLFGINLEETGFNYGKIPDQLWQESAITMQYRL